MDANAYAGEVVAAVVYLFVGVRLFQLSCKTRHVPEKLIAASFFFWVLAYAIWDIPYAFVESEAMVPPVYSFGSLVALALGNLVFACFIRAVFRPEERWALRLVVAVAVANLAGVVGSGSTGDWEGTNPLANPWYWLEFFGSLAPTLWMGAEGFAQFFKARKQLKLGFCEPMTCNRFLLWGIAGSLWAVLEMIVTSSGFGIGLLEILPIAIVWFVFFPPAFYCRWVEGGGRAASA
jgi:hypothetical protein